MTTQRAGSSQLRQQRRELAHRRRRIVFNNDGDDLGATGADTLDGFLRARTTALLGSHVDAIWYYSTWGMRLHHEQGPFGKLYAAQYETDGARQQVENYRKLLAATGKDTLEIMIDVARKHGLEIFYANRMNDTHDSFFPGMMYLNKIEHPDWCLSTREEGAKYQYPDVRSCWAAWNFEVPEIRRLTVDAMREVCERYDIDGIELDFWRQTACFPETLEHKPVTREHLDLMNDMVRQIRSAVDDAGLKRGRPFLLAGRCLEDVVLSRNSGMDVETWLREGLVDILSVAYATEHTPPLDGLVRLAHQHDTPIYPICNGFHLAALDKQDDGAAMVGNLPVWRGCAMNILQQGADGIQTFNLFDPNLRQWWELGEREAMLKLDRTYVWDFRPSQREGRDTYAELRITRHKKPVGVGKDGCEPMPVYVGEDLSAPDSSGRTRALTLRVRAKGLVAGHGLTLTVNGKPLPDPQPAPEPGAAPADVWMTCKIKGDTFRPGCNLVAAQVDNEAGAAPAIDEVRLDVRY